MNKLEIIDHIAKSADISKAAAGRSLDAAVTAIKTAMKKGSMVTLVGFGTFYVGAPCGAHRAQSANGRGNQHQGGEGPEIPSWKSPQGCSKLAALPEPVRLKRAGGFPRGALSSAGRASPLQGECRRFDPVSTHQSTRRSGSSVG